MNIYLNNRTFVFVFLILLLLAGCEKGLPDPISQNPDPVDSLLQTSRTDEPDTVHAIVTAEINGVPWKFETPNGNAAAANLWSPETMSYFSPGDAYISTGQNIHPKNSYIRLSVNFKSNLHTFQTQWMDKWYTLHSWDSEELVIMYTVPPSIITQTPFIPDTIRSLRYYKKRRGESFQPGPGGGYSIYDLDREVIHSFTYGFTPGITAFDTSVKHYMKFTQLDVIKRRTSGEFSFSLKNKETGETLVVKNGKFINCRFGVISRY